jgi:hypothetical protein
MSIFAIILLRQPRDPKKWDGILQDRVIWVSTDLEQTLQHFKTIDGNNGHFHATYYKPISKLIVETKQNHEFEDHFVNEKTVAQEDVTDVPLKDLVTDAQNQIQEFENKIRRVSKGEVYWDVDKGDEVDLHHVGRLPQTEQIDFFQDCIRDHQTRIKELQMHYK